MKKTIATLVAVIAALMLVIGVFAADTVLYKGDLNRDGKVLANEARKILRMSARLDPQPEAGSEDFVIADVNGDGRILANDARTALRMSARLDPMIEFEPAQPTTDAPVTQEPSSEPQTPVVTTVAPTEPVSPVTEPTTVAPTEPVTPVTEPTTVAPTEPVTPVTEPTTVAPTEPVTPVTEPTTVAPPEPTTVAPPEPTTVPPTEPVTGRETDVPESDWPAAIKAFFSGRYRMNGFLRAGGDNSEIDFATNGKDIRASQSMADAGINTDVVILIKQEKTLLGRPKNVMYFLAEKDGAKYYCEFNETVQKALGIDDIGLDDLELGAIEGAKLEYVEHFANGRDVWRFTGDGSAVEIIMEGDTLKRIIIYDESGQPDTVMDAESFTYGSDLPDSLFTTDGYKKYPILQGGALGFFSWLMGESV